MRSLSVVLVGLFLAACSGAERSLLEEPTASPGSSAQTATAPSSPSTPGDPQLPPAPKPSAPAGSDECPQESEDNDEIGSANAMGNLVCGEAPPGDIDSFRFQLPSSATTMNIRFSGSILVSVLVDGLVVRLSPDIGSEPVPVIPGATYVFRIRSTQGTTAKYRLAIET